MEYVICLPDLDFIRHVQGHISAAVSTTTLTGRYKLLKASGR